MRKLDLYKGKGLLLSSVRELEEYFESLESDRLLTWDWETTGLEYDSIPLGLALHQRGKEPCFCPVDYFFTEAVPIGDIVELCNRYFPRFRMIGHNTKFDSMINVMQGIKDENCRIFADTLTMVHLYDPALDMQLETRVAEDFGYRKPTFERKCEEAFPGSKRGQWKWNKINWSVSGNELLPILAAYACEDAYWETKLYHYYRPKLDSDAMWVLDNIEMPLVNILRDMKIRGVLIDVPFLRSLGDVVDVKLAELREAIYGEAGCVFNLQSSPQKQNILYDKMGLPVLKATKSGGRSTDADVMEMLADKGYKIAEYFVKYSEIQKLNSGYIQSIPALVDRRNVLRGDLNSNGTKTGRFSSQNPNLQNQPNNHDFPIRRAFIPRPGMVFLNYDYSQLELRVMAHVSQDKHFLEVFRNGEDPHGDVARRLGIPRRGAKVVNFGVLYGMGSDKLAHTINVSTKEADKIINIDYLRTYAGFAAWKVKTENFAKRYGFVKNIFGRIRRLPNATKGPLERTPKEFYGALRQSVNCVDTETEIFTKRGWLRYDEVRKGDIALTYNGDTDVMEWQPVIEVVRMPYIGDMISLEGDAHSSLSTPNHRWFVRDAVSGPCVTRNSEFILGMSSNGSYRFPLCANVDAPDNADFSDEWLELFGIFITDGHHNSLHRIEICQSSSSRKTGNIERIRYLIDKVGDEIVSERDLTREGYAPCHYWNLRGAFTEWCKSVTDQRKLVTDKSWLYSLSQRQASKLLDGILLGDGYTSKRSKTLYVGNIYKEMIDFYSEVVILTGKSYGISTQDEHSKHKGYTLSIKRRRNAYCGLLRRQRVPYNGVVWCPRVDNQSFLMRRNGKVCITRNTIVQGSGADMVKLAMIKMATRFKEEGIDAHLVLQVHDEVLVEASIADMYRAQEIVIDSMENAVKLSVPMLVDGKIITNWAEMKDDDTPSFPLRFDYSLYTTLL